MKQIWVEMEEPSGYRATAEFDSGEEADAWIEEMESLGYVFSDMDVAIFTEEEHEEFARTGGYSL